MYNTDLYFKYNFWVWTSFSKYKNGECCSFRILVFSTLVFQHVSFLETLAIHNVLSEKSAAYGFENWRQNSGWSLSVVFHFYVEVSIDSVCTGSFPTIFALDYMCLIFHFYLLFLKFLPKTRYPEQWPGCWSPPSPPCFLFSSPWYVSTKQAPASSQLRPIISAKTVLSASHLRSQRRCGTTHCIWWLTKLSKWSTIPKRWWIPQPKRKV